MKDHSSVKMTVSALGLALLLSAPAFADPPTVEPDPAPQSAATVKDEPCAPGCDCTTGEDGKGVLGMIERRAETVRTRNKAYAQQIFKKPDNTMGMTCFDRALGVTSRLGTIFSDLPSGASVVNGQLQQASQSIPAMDSSVFGNSSFPNMGMDKNLTTVLSGVVSDQVQKHADNFAPGDFSSGSLSGVLGTTSLGYLSNMAGDMQGSLNNLTNGPIQQMNSAMGGINSLINTLNGALDMIGMAAPAQAMVIIGTINGLWDQIEDQAQNIMSTLMNQLIGQFIGPMFNQLLGSGNSLTANKCDYMGKLWNGSGLTGAVAGFKPLVGSGMEKGLPYFKVKDLLNGTMPGISEDTTPDFVQSILNEDGIDGVINKALQDQQGPLSGPGNTPSWTTPPVLSPGMSTDDIIGVMNGGGVGDARTAGILPAPDVPPEQQTSPF